MNTQLAHIGHNEPPSAIDMATEGLSPLATFLDNTPVIQDETAAREAKLFLDRTKAMIGDLEAARKKEADPLYTQWKAVNEAYKPISTKIERLEKELKSRLAAYIRAEEEKRRAEAEAARKAAEEAERIAREAEASEREAIDNATQGEIGADVAGAIEEADSRFADYKAANRAATIAERDAKVRVGGGFGRVTSLRTQEVWAVQDAAKAMASIGLTTKIEEALISSAKDYRKLLGELPAGIVVTKERVL